MRDPGYSISRPLHEGGMFHHQSIRHQHPQTTGEPVIEGEETTNPPRTGDQCEMKLNDDPRDPNRRLNHPLRCIEASAGVAIRTTMTTMTTDPGARTEGTPKTEDLDALDSHAADPAISCQRRDHRTQSSTKGSRNCPQRRWGRSTRTRIPSTNSVRLS